MRACVRACETRPLTARRIWADVSRELGAEECVWASKGGNNRRQGKLHSEKLNDFVPLNKYHLDEQIEA